MGEMLLKIYKRTVSPLLGERCRFHPSCSNYLVEAIKTHGLLKGLMFGIYRLLRCQPLCRGGFDPVPTPSGTESR